ncbi:MAG: PTS sugar transporter subunit IIB [Gemmatimonadaceae bacterium]|nr:PTS sugar transporter subunit IIB [Gemmatimonadaceae bacterium]
MLEYFRIDDRLIHGQVVVGWGQPCGLGFLVLVDDAVVGSEWEQELYRMGVPPEMDVYFDSVESAARRMADYRADRRPGLLLTGDIATMQRLVNAVPDVRCVTIGGIHHKDGRRARLRYVFLTPEEERELTAMAAQGIQVVAQDVPMSPAVPLADVLAGDGSG